MSTFFRTSGITDQVLIGDPSDFNFGGNNFSLRMLFVLDGTVQGTGGYLISKWSSVDDSTRNWGLIGRHLHTTRTTLFVSEGVGSLITLQCPNFVAADGVLYDLTVERIIDRVHWTINGEYKGYTDLPTGYVLNTTSVQTRISGRDGGVNLTGLLRGVEVRVNGVLEGSYIQHSDYGLDYLPDHSGNGRDGTVVDPGWERRFTEFDSAYNFNF